MTVILGGRGLKASEVLCSTNILAPRPTRSSYRSTGRPRAFENKKLGETLAEEGRYIETPEN